MKKTTVLKSTLFSLALLSGAAMAAPANMVIINSSNLSTNAYVHGAASPNAVGAHSSTSIPWADVTNLCHNTVPPLLRGSDPCSFEVYATDDAAVPQKIDVGTVTMYVSDGDILHVANKAIPYGLKIVALSPGQFELLDGFI